MKNNTKLADMTLEPSMNRESKATGDLKLSTFVITLFYELQKTNVRISPRCAHLPSYARSHEWIQFSFPRQ